MILNFHHSFIRKVVFSLLFTAEQASPSRGRDYKKFIDLKIQHSITRVCEIVKRCTT